MSDYIEQRFEAYCGLITAEMEHADRRMPAQWYLKGLILPGERKSVEPMAARVCPDNVQSAHQSMHHLVAAAGWSDGAVLAAVARQVVPELLKTSRQCWWILDDTSHVKKGRHSVGVARQYCGRLGKQDNCQVAVSLSLATVRGSLPLDYRLYLPDEWTDDRARCRTAGVPREIEFRSKGELAREQIEDALVAGVARGIVLGDAGYGNEAAFRDWLSEQTLPYVLGVRANTAVWWGEHQPAPTSRPTRKRVKRDARHKPVSVLKVARALPPQSWRTVSWRDGTRGKLSSRFARVRVCAANDDLARHEEWLLIEWPHGEAEPRHYWLSTLPDTSSFRTLVFNAMGRWMIERDYEELKSELGLSHYEGRNWRGFHHHATLCIAAYGFLMLERLRGKKNSARLQAPAIPQGFRPRGSLSDASPQSVLHRLSALRSRSRHCTHSPSVPVLRQSLAQHDMTIIKHSRTSLA
jgi:SRSO17 transposase